MRFQCNGKVYDTEKAQHLFDYESHAYYRTKGGTYFVAFWVKRRKDGCRWWWPVFETEMAPWGCTRTDREVRCKAFDAGLDLAALGLEPLPEAD